MILRVRRKPLQAGAIVFGLAALLAAPQAADAQNLGTIGTGTAGESTATRAGGTPTGPAPRLLNGHVDFSGVYSKPWTTSQPRK